MYLVKLPTNVAGKLIGNDGRVVNGKLFIGKPYQDPRTAPVEVKDHAQPILVRDGVVGEAFTETQYVSLLLLDNKNRQVWYLSKIHLTESIYFAVSSYTLSDLFKKQCREGYVGSAVEYSKTYTAESTSQISQQDAESKAYQIAYDKAYSEAFGVFRNEGLANANLYGVCSFDYNAAIDFIGYWRNDGAGANNGVYDISPYKDLVNQYPSPIAPYYLTNDIYNLINIIKNKENILLDTMSIPEVSSVYREDGSLFSTTVIKTKYVGTTLGFAFNDSFNNGLAHITDHKDALITKNYNFLYGGGTDNGVRKTTISFDKYDFIVGANNLDDYIKNVFIPKMQSYYDDWFNQITQNRLNHKISLNSVNRLHLNHDINCLGGRSTIEWNSSLINYQFALGAEYEYGVITTTTYYDTEGKIIQVQDKAIPSEGSQSPESSLSFLYKFSNFTIKDKYAGEYQFPYSYYDFPGKQIVNIYDSPP